MSTIEKLVDITSPPDSFWCIICNFPNDISWGHEQVRAGGGVHDARRGAAHHLLSVLGPLVRLGDLGDGVQREVLLGGLEELLLLGVEVEVCAVLVHELGVAALLLHPALVEHDDLVDHLDAGEPPGHYDGGPARAHPLQGLLQPEQELDDDNCAVLDALLFLAHKCTRPNKKSCCQSLSSRLGNFYMA